MSPDPPPSAIPALTRIGAPIQIHGHTTNSPSSLITFTSSHPGTRMARISCSPSISRSDAVCLSSVSTNRQDGYDQVNQAQGGTTRPLDKPSWRTFYRMSSSRRRSFNYPKRHTFCSTPDEEVNKVHVRRGVGPRRMLISFILDSELLECDDGHKARSFAHMPLSRVLEDHLQYKALPILRRLHFLLQLLCVHNKCKRVRRWLLDACTTRGANFLRPASHTDLRPRILILSSCSLGSRSRRLHRLSSLAFPAAVNYLCMP